MTVLNWHIVEEKPMDKSNLPPLYTESTPLPEGARFIVIRTRHGIYAQGRVLKGEGVDVLQAEAEKKLQAFYSRTTIPIATLQQPIE